MHRTATHRFTSLFLAVALLFTAVSAFAAGEGGGGRKVNVNSADVTQLALLPRVGPSVAQRIVEFRKENGPFKSPDDLMLVRGIGEKTFALIKPYVATSGETTLKEKVKSAKKKESSR